MKKLAYYLNLNYPVTITKDHDGERVYFEAGIPDLPGCNAYGKNIEEAIKNLDEAKRVWLKVSLKKKLPIPEPVSEDEFSGKFLLRIPAKLHMQLTLDAKKENLSLNQYIRKALETHITLESLHKKVEEMSEKINEFSVEISQSSEANVIFVETQAMSNSADFFNWNLLLSESSKKGRTIEPSFQEEA